jgi:hypothetical protein
MESSKFLEVWVSDEREYVSRTCDTQFAKCSVKDLEKENISTKIRLSKKMRRRRNMYKT